MTTETKIFIEETTPEKVQMEEILVKENQSRAIEDSKSQAKQPKEEKKKKEPKSKNNATKENGKDLSGQLHIQLSHPGMTSYHKVGLAGLYMTLRSLEKDRALFSALCEASGEEKPWEYTSTSVTLRWKKDPIFFFSELLRVSFQLRDGLFYFHALGDPLQSPNHTILLQECLLGTILQHGKSRGAEKEISGSLVIEQEDTFDTFHYRNIDSYAQQSADFAPNKSFSVAGWAFPGGAVRHTGFPAKYTGLSEDASCALCLIFACVGCLYFRVRSRSQGLRSLYALAIPELNDLDLYSKVRRRFAKLGAEDFLIAGNAEAGLQVLLELESLGIQDRLRGVACRVIPFVMLPWSKQQKSRMAVLTLGALAPESLRLYRLCKQLFRVQRIKPEKKDAFWSVPQMPALISENLVKKKPWWNGFADFVADKDRRKSVFSRNERGGLQKMVKNQTAMPPNSPEAIFVTACHEAWRRRLGKLGERARRESRSFSQLVSQEFEKLRIAFSRSKNSATLRATLSDFWARAGSLPTLQGDGWRILLPLLEDWAKSRDLALLALASYQPNTKEEEEALSKTTQVETEEESEENT